MNNVPFLGEGVKKHDLQEGLKLMLAIHMYTYPSDVFDHAIHIIANPGHMLLKKKQQCGTQTSTLMVSSSC